MTIGIDINEVLRDYLRAFEKQYNKVIDPTFVIDYDEITSFDLMEVFPFLDEEGMPHQAAFNAFRFEDCAFEIYARADLMEREIPAQLNMWVNATLRNFDEGKNPDVILFSPFEMNLSIPSTLGFLARTGMKFRNIKFPIDSTKMWDKCDIIITANPKLLSMTPDGKHSFKINAPYNKEVKGTYEFDTIVELIQDKDKTVEKIINGEIK